MSQLTEEGLRKTLEAAIRRIKIADDRISFMGGWGALEHGLLTFCLNHQITDKTHLTVILRLKLQELGRECLEEHVIMGKTVADDHVLEWPDHITSPHALAFAMRTGAVSQKEMAHIHFCHGETAETFFQGVEKTLPEIIWTQMINPPEVVQTGSETVSELYAPCACDC